MTARHQADRRDRHHRHAPSARALRDLSSTVVAHGDTLTDAPTPALIHATGPKGNS